jgi:predicted metalloprotease with PDZ domain
MVGELKALFVARHWTDYRFLLTASNVFAGYGVEHQESSDDGVGGAYLSSPSAFRADAMILGHEFIHSWNGKYRVPRGIATRDMNTPYDTSLLWVYEGLTVYYASVIAYRDGILSSSEWPDYLAGVYARFDNEPGRNWRSLEDTAISASVLYPSSYEYSSERRGVDFYLESELLWLRADAIIRNVTGDRRNLDDFVRLFFGGIDSGPVQRAYDRSDIVAALTQVAPYDWNAFINKYVETISPHPPDGFSLDGWELVYTDQPSEEVPYYDLRDSLGLQARINESGEILDVLFGSPAWKAGLGIDTLIEKVNGQKYTPDLLFDAVKSAAVSHTPINLLVTKDGVERTVSIPYFGGLRYPHLRRRAGTADLLSEVIQPRRPRP